MCTAALWGCGNICRHAQGSGCLTYSVIKHACNLCWTYTCTIHPHTKTKQKRKIKSVVSVFFSFFLSHPFFLTLGSPPSCFSPSFSLPSPMAESGRATGSKTCKHQNVGQPSVLSYRLETAVRLWAILSAAEASNHRSAVLSYNFTFQMPPALKLLHFVPLSTPKSDE